MPKFTDKPHTLYMTHGGVVTLKILSKNLYKDDYHWSVSYDWSSQRYSFCDPTNIVLTDAAGSTIHFSHLPSFSSYKDLISYILTYAPSIRCVALDANLEIVGGLEFTRVAHEIVTLSRCEKAVFFTDTNLCIQDTERYVKGSHALKPPSSLKQAIVSERKDLFRLDGRFVKVRHGCCSAVSRFFSCANTQQSKKEKTPQWNYYFWKNARIHHDIPPEGSELLGVSQDPIEVAQYSISDNTRGLNDCTPLSATENTKPNEEHGALVLKL